MKIWKSMSNSLSHLQLEIKRCLHILKGNSTIDKTCKKGRYHQIIKLCKNSVCLLSWGKCLLMRSNILCKYLRNYESSSLTAAISSKSFSNQQEWESLRKGSMSSSWIFCTQRTMIIKPIKISNCCVKCAICQIYQYTR